MNAPKIIQTIQQVVEWEGRVSDFISGPVPSNALAASAQESYRRGCDRYSAAPGFIQGLGVTGQALGRLCRQYLDDQGYSEPEQQVPFQGGQCRTTLYRFAATATNQTGQSFNLQTDLYGPVSLEVGVRNNNDGFVEIIGNSGPTDDPPNFFGAQSGVGANGARFTVSGVSVVPLNGPDNCGNPPGDYVPGPNPAPDPGPTFEPTVDPDFPSFPRFKEPDTYVDPVGGPVPWPDINIDIGLGGGGGVGGGSGDGGDFPPTGPGVAGQPSDSGDGGEVEGEAPAGEVLLGLLVELLVIPPFARQVQNSLVPAYIGSAYVSMGWEGQLDLDNSGQFARAIEYYIAPLNATHWRVTAAIGYNLRVTPYYTQAISEV